MVTTKRKLRSARPKALFGVDGGLMAAAIALQTANDTVNTIMNVNQAKQNARAIREQANTQAQAINKQASTQARAMQEQNENNNMLQQKTIEANKEAFKEQTDVLKEMNMNMLIAQGKQNTEDRREASRLTVKKGGNVKRKLRDGFKTPVGENGNMPFIVTDGGGVIPLGQTPEGYDLYEIVGDNHEHYHKSQGGKYKTGVGFKFANGGVVEGEGNQSSSTGELVLVTPDDAMFISKHSIKGFNPTKAVLAGMHPKQAFNIQEGLKSKRFTAKEGTNLYKQQPDVSGDTVQSRTKALSVPDISAIYNAGYNVLDGQMNQTDLSRLNVMRAKKGCSLKRPKAKDGWKKQWEDLGTMGQLGVIGVGANALNAVGATVGNILGNSWITDANNYASEVLGNAYSSAGNTMAEAWRSRKGIDPSIISDADYDYTPAVAALRTARVNKNADLESLNRQERDELSSIERSSISSAKRSILRGQVADKYNSLRNQIYQQQDNESENIKQANAQMINQMSVENAKLAQQARQSKNEAMLNIARYNTDIANENIMGAADAESSALLNVAGINADTAKANATSRGSMMSNISNTWNNALQSGLGTYTNLYSARLGADKDTLEYVDRRKRNNNTTQIAYQPQSYSIAQPYVKQISLKRPVLTGSAASYFNHPILG